MSGVSSNFVLELEVVVATLLPDGLEPAEIPRLVRYVLDGEGATGAWTVAVVLTDDDRLRALHRDFMGIDGETDVMTFPAEDAAGPSGGRFGGDVIVSVERAAAQGPAFGQTAADEVRFLVIHGLLHLLGWDDDADDERGRMLRRQADLLTAFRATSEKDVGRIVDDRDVRADNARGEGREDPST